MIKTLGLFRKKPGMTRDAFVDRYESPEYGHAQFAIKICPWQDDYRRDFICDTPPIPDAELPGNGKRPPMDVVMITTARDLAQAELTGKALADPKVGKMIADDEEALFDRTKMTIVNVEERATSADRLQPRPAGHGGEPSLKVLSFARMSDPSQTRDEFAAGYEAVADLIADKLSDENGSFLAGYKRNYVNHDAFANQGHVAVAPPKADFDVMSELWFWSVADFRLYQAAWLGQAGKELAVAQSRTIDPSSLNEIFVDEYVHTRGMLDAALAAHEKLKAANG